jgi:hypothetical protein
VGGMAPSASMNERKRVCGDWMRTVVRQVAAQEAHRMWPVGGVMVIV